jgi:hypothetical protein
MSYICKVFHQNSAPREAHADRVTLEKVLKISEYLSLFDCIQLTTNYYFFLIQAMHRR